MLYANLNSSTQCVGIKASFLLALEWTVLEQIEAQQRDRSAMS